MTQRADVLLLAAGYGNRLRPQTLTVPKPLIPVGGKPLIEWNLELLRRSGFRKVFVNAHHLAGKLREHLGTGERWDMTLTIVEEPVLLDTGGAIKNIEGRLEHDVLLTVNSDILVGPDFDVAGLLDAHCAHREGADSRHPEATLVLRDDPRAAEFGEIGLDRSGRILRFLDVALPGGAPERTGLMYTGVQAISRTMLRFMPEAGSIFSITRDTYPDRERLQKGGTLMGIVYGGYWNDVGTFERLAEAEADVHRVFGIPRL